MLERFSQESLIQKAASATTVYAVVATFSAFETSDFYRLSQRVLDSRSAFGQELTKYGSEVVSKGYMGAALITGGAVALSIWLAGTTIVNLTANLANQKIANSFNLH